MTASNKLLNHKVGVHLPSQTSVFINPVRPPDEGEVNPIPNMYIQIEQFHITISMLGNDS